MKEPGTLLELEAFGRFADEFRRNQRKRGIILSVDEVKQAWRQIPEPPSEPSPKSSPYDPECTKEPTYSQSGRHWY